MTNIINSKAVIIYKHLISTFERKNLFYQTNEVMCLRILYKLLLIKINIFYINYYSLCHVTFLIIISLVFRCFSDNILHCAEPEYIPAYPYSYSYIDLGNGTSLCSEDTMKEDVMSW